MHINSNLRLHIRVGGTLGISGRGCAAGTLEPLTYTRASSLNTRVNSPNPPYPRIAVSLV